MQSARVLFRLLARHARPAPPTSLALLGLPRSQRPTIELPEGQADVAGVGGLRVGRHLEQAEVAVRYRGGVAGHRPAGVLPRLAQRAVAQVAPQVGPAVTVVGALRNVGAQGRCGSARAKRGGWGGSRGAGTQTGTVLAGPGQASRPPPDSMLVGRAGAGRLRGEKVRAGINPAAGAAPGPAAAGRAGGRPTCSTQLRKKSAEPS